LLLAVLSCFQDIRFQLGRDAFVGIQMAWNLQPFVGDRNRPFELFRHNEGNFYTAVIYSLQKLASGSGQPAAVTPPRPLRQHVGDMPNPEWPVWRDSSRTPGRAPGR